MNTISLSKYLSRYVGLKGENLKKLHHEDVKILFPYIKRASFKFIEKNPELINKNKVVIVNDGRSCIPYYIENKMFDDFDELLLEEDKKEDINYKEYDYSKLSIYELKQLLRRAFNSYKNQFLAKKELTNRGIVKKKYKRNEFKNYNE